MNFRSRNRLSVDGLTDNRPITYEEVKSFYDRVDRLIGIYRTQIPGIIYTGAFCYQKIGRLSGGKEGGKKKRG